MLELPASLDTRTRTAQDLTLLYERLSVLSENPSTVPLEQRALFQEHIQAVTIPLLNALVMGDHVPVAAPAASPSSQQPQSSSLHGSGLPSPSAPPTIDVRGRGQAPEDEKRQAAPTPKIPHVGIAKYLRGNFGAGIHEKFHFSPTDTKPHHGVWGANVGQVRQWVQACLNSIFAGDGYVVGSKPGNSGTHRYLVNMGSTIGYLSGSAVSGKPPATHIELYLDPKGNTVSAFPSDPSLF